MSDRLRILVVEDCENMAHFIGRILDPLRAAFPGCSVVYKGSMADALLVIAELPHPDVIVLDAKLPDSTISETISRLKELDEKHPVVVVSAIANSQEIELITKLGIEFVTKTVERGFIDLLRSAILRTLLRGHERKRSKLDADIERIHELVDLLQHHAS